MNELQRISNEDGLYKLQKVKIFYEYIALENSYIRKDMRNNKIEIIEREKKLWKI